MSARAKASGMPAQRGLSLRATAVAGALLAGTAVALGAFGTHLLTDVVVPSRLATFETGVRYQMFHGLGLLTIAALRRAGIAPALLLAGTVVFSGSLYALVATDVSMFGAVAPIGGALLLAGWGVLTWSMARQASAAGS